MIALKDVSISFNKKTPPLLSKVDLAVRRGETFVLIGSSGSGKSVLLKMIAGLISPTSGHVLVDEKDIHRISNREKGLLTSKMGMLFQKNALFDSFTVSENLAFPLREVGGLSEDEIQKKVSQYLRLVELESAGPLHPDEISGGMQKRVGIARALILSPEIILYDDPTAGLDPITSKIIIELIIKLNRELGSTVVAITNDMNRAYQLAAGNGRIGMIMDHSLQITGSVNETKNFKNESVQNFIHGVSNLQLSDGELYGLGN